MHVIKTKIPDVLIIEQKVFGDERGFFMETWNARKFREVGINATFVQDNHSRSIKNTLRGLHYQVRYPQGKLVRVASGEVLDIVVDLRPESKTFGHWVGEYLSEKNKRMMWVPPGFAHGFLVTSEIADFQYKCTEFYAPEFERTIRWDDSVLNIDWGIKKTDKPLLSSKDSRGQTLQQAREELIGCY